MKWLFLSFNDKTTIGNYNYITTIENKSQILTIFHHFVNYSFVGSFIVHYEQNGLQNLWVLLNSKDAADYNEFKKNPFFRKT